MTRQGLTRFPASYNLEEYMSHTTATSRNAIATTERGLLLGILLNLLNQGKAAVGRMR